MEANTIITGHMLKEKARWFWDRLPQYRHEEMPKFSIGWLSGFKKRHGNKEHVRHGESGSVDTSKTLEGLRRVQEIVAEYASEDVYNCDETGLFWKNVPDRGLATARLAGIKKEKARITIHFCCNSTGSDRVTPWLIGTAARPLAFRNAGVNIDHIGFIWRSNGSAWMTTVIMAEWLAWFDARMRNRKVLLLMDSFKPHELAVNEVDLQNTRVEFLPKNATSLYQPLDQGIIATFKAYYRKQWLQYMLDEIEANREPSRTMNVLKAARYTVMAWQVLMGPETCANCFKKSQIFGPVHGPHAKPTAVQSDAQSAALSAAQAVNQASQSSARYDASEGDSDLNTEIVELVDELIQTGAVPRLNQMDIQFIINPPTEDVQESGEEIEEEIAERIAAQFDAGPEAESDEDVEIVLKVSVREAKAAVATLRLYEEQRSQPREDWIYRLSREANRIHGDRFEKIVQKDIRSYFG